MNTTPASRPSPRRIPMRILLVALLAACGGTALANDAAPLDGPAAASAEALAPGKFEWTPEASPTGPVVVVVSLAEQMAHVYRGGVRIGRSTISSGKPGYETPTGVFPILQKRKTHFSNKYDNAPMPFMQRLTWDGVALHAGRIPGYPASHGCIRLPHAFAEQLFALTEHGVNVVVADEGSHGLAVVHPGDTAPVDAITGLERGLDTGGIAARDTAGPGMALAGEAR